VDLKQIGAVTILIIIVIIVGILAGAGVGIWHLLKSEHSKPLPPFTITVTGFSTGTSTQSNTFIAVQTLILQDFIMFYYPATLSGVLYFYLQSDVTFNLTALGGITVPTVCTTCQAVNGKTAYSVPIFGFPSGTGNLGFPIITNQPILQFQYLFLAS
jgi:hypothetical protein